MRADRLVAVTLYLQRHGRVRAAELAEHLEVSVATARRDLEALSSAGVPVYPQRGRGGGWQLVGGARTDLTGLTEPEVRALFLALGNGEGDATARTALSKLVRALPEPFRESAEVAGSAVRVEPRRWQERPAHPVPDERLLRDAIVQRRRCTIGYRSRGSETERSIAVDPWRLVDKAGVAYLLAGTARGPRTYRLDRMDHVAMSQERFERPPESVIEDHWRQTTLTVEAARTSVRAVVSTDMFALTVLAEQFGSGFERLDDDRAAVAAHTPRGLAEQLAGWGSRVVVLDAPEVVAELQSIGAELVAAYGSGGARSLRSVSSYRPPSSPGSRAIAVRWVCDVHAGMIELPTEKAAGAQMTQPTTEWSDPREQIEYSVLLPTGRLAPRRFATEADAQAWARPDEGEQVVSFNAVCDCEM